MNVVEEWEKFWQEKSQDSITDHEYDRGRRPRRNEIEALSTEELLEFADPRPGEVIFDAGCGSGVNLLRLHSKVRRVIGMDYTHGAIDRCEKRIGISEITNVELIRGSVTHIPLSARSVDKVLCMSVLQYLDDNNVRSTFKEFARILTGDGVVILHVKNLSSIYLATLRVAKRIKLLLGTHARLEYVRSFQWYMKELNESGYEILDYNSFNVFTVDFMPRTMVESLQEIELRNRNNALFRSGFIRRHGSELKIKAKFCGKNASLNFS